jgi:hypothetical protein
MSLQRIHRKNKPREDKKYKLWIQKGEDDQENLKQLKKAKYLFRKIGKDQLDPILGDWWRKDGNQ